jgi:hypothetical protein
MAPLHLPCGKVAGVPNINVAGHDVFSPFVFLTIRIDAGEIDTQIGPLKNSSVFLLPIGGVLSGSPEIVCGPPQGSRGDSENPGEKRDVRISVVENVFPPSGECTKNREQRTFKKAAIFSYGLKRNPVIMGLITKCCP